VSPLRRAQQTAAILTQFAGWPERESACSCGPGADPEGLLALLARSHDSRIALVGHQPGLGRLLAACLPAGWELRRSSSGEMGVALLCFQGAARAGCGQLMWLLPPRILRAAG